MSLKTRLVLLAVALAVTVVVAISALYLGTMVDAWSTQSLERAELAVQQAKTSLVDTLQTASKVHRMETVADTKRVWTETVTISPTIAEMLQRILANTKVLVELQIAGEDGKILASSNPSRKGGDLPRRTPFAQWRNEWSLKRLVDVFRASQDYEVTVPLGIAEQKNPVFTIQAVVASAFLRNELEPSIGALAWLSAGALALSIFLGLVAASLALRPLARISATLDRINKGEFEEAEIARVRSGEFAIVESKLTVLGLRDAEARRELATRLDGPSRLAALGHLTSGVAHEIKNPLNAIALRVELLRERLRDSDSPELDSEITIIAREVNRLDRVVKTFLDFARPVTVQFQRLDLSMLAGDVAQLVQPQAVTQHIELIFKAPQEPCWIRGDADLLRQAILNVVVNGIDAMAGATAKSGALLAITLEAVEGNIELTVSDQGPGIPPDVKAKVFQLFFTTKDKGSGIGLAMTYRAMQLHNGTIEITDSPGKGTTFRLRFPRVDAPIPAVEAHA